MLVRSMAASSAALLFSSHTRHPPAPRFSHGCCLSSHSLPRHARSFGGGLKTVGFGCFDLLALLALKARWTTEYDERVCHDDGDGSYHSNETLHALMDRVMLLFLRDMHALCIFLF